MLRKELVDVAFDDRCLAGAELADDEHFVQMFILRISVGILALFEKKMGNQSAELNKFPRRTTRKFSNKAMEENRELHGYPASND